MKLLEEKILAEGHALNESILKVDSFINHQVDPQLMYEMGKDIADHFRGQGVTLSLIHISFSRKSQHSCHQQYNFHN